MPFTVHPGEEVIHRVQGRGAGVAGEIDYTITNRRLVSASRTRGSVFGAGDETKWLYLDLIANVQERRWLPRKTYLLGLLLIIAGIAASITLIGIIVGIPLLIIGALLLALALVQRREAIIIGSEGGGAEIPVLLTSGEAEEFCAAFHAAREAAISK